MSKPEKRPVHIAEIRKTCKGTEYISVYLRRTFREGGKVQHETVGNLFDLPDDLLVVIKRRLAAGLPLVGDGGTMSIRRSLPHGNVAAVLGTLRNLGLDQIIGARPCRERGLVMAMIVDRVISPGSKLSCSRGVQPETAQNTLAEELRLGEVEVHELYAAIIEVIDRRLNDLTPELFTAADSCPAPPVPSENSPSIRSRAGHRVSSRGLSGVCCGPCEGSGCRRRFHRWRY